LYDREGYYVAPDGSEYSDNAVRYAALAHAAARLAQGVDTVPRPHIVHAHDWHAALTPLLMHQKRIKDVKTVLTLHNVAFQGVFPMALADSLDIAHEYRTGDGMEFWGQLNFLKAGIRYADLITVVSSNYAREILTPKFGCGLEGVLAQRGSDLISIPNGIDTRLWDPEVDIYLRGCNFSAEHLSKKAACKSRLQHSFGLQQNPRATVMAMGSRLTLQKMADLAASAIPSSLDAHPDLQVCVIGQGDHRLEAALQDVAARYPGRCGVHIGFDEGQAHLLHAGADMLLHGSRFEPFGLTPLYSMRYGTVPIASKVGGMADTILDPGGHRPLGVMRTGTGILFEGEQPDDMTNAIDRALALRAHPEVWRAMQMNGMRADFSWAKTAPAYLSAYQSLCPNVALDRVPERLRSVSAGRIGNNAHAASALSPEGSGFGISKRARQQKGRDGANLEPVAARRASAA
jgi:starch synthase